MATWSVSVLVSGAVIAASSAGTSALAEQLDRPVSAAKAPGAPGAPSAASQAAKALPNYDAMMAVVDKLFPPQPDPDPSRLAKARSAVQTMWPDGAYARMMSGFIDNAMRGVMKMKKSDLSSLASDSAKPKASASAAEPTVHDRVTKKDPNFDQRMSATLTLVHEELSKLSAVIDPRMRDGLARAMARRFDDRQLGDIDAFFATPSGHALASEYLQLWFEPDTLRSMFGAFPEMMKLMPDMMQKLKVINEKYPKPAAPTGKAVTH